jgi:hypothetical protein
MMFGEGGKPSLPLGASKSYSITLNPTAMNYRGCGGAVSLSPTKKPHQFPMREQGLQPLPAPLQTPLSVFLVWDL